MKQLLSFIVVLGVSCKSLCSQDFSDSRGLPYITNYEASSYKAGIQNWDIVENSQGLLYVANNMGLLEFDGQEWSRYGLNGTKVRSIFVSENERVYTGSQADFGYLYPDDTGQLIYTSLADSLPSELRDFDETWKIYGIDDLIYFCTFQRVYVYDGNEIRAINSDYRLEISFMEENRMYVQEWELGLSEIKNGRLELIQNGHFFKDKRISNILNYDRDHLLISTFNDGVFLYNGSVKPFVFKGDYWRNDFIINYSTRLKDGTIALGTQNAGLFIVDKEGDLIMNLDKDSGLLDLTINYIYEDAQNNLWLAMNNGVARVDLNSPFTLINDRLGLSGSGYTALLYDESIYLGTNNGLYRWDKQSNRMTFVEGTAGQVYNLQEINGKLLMGHHNGAYIIEHNQATQISDEKGAWLFRPHPTQTNMLIQGTYVGLNLLEWQGDRLVNKQKITGFDESSRVMEFEDKVLWVAQGYKGVFKLKLSDDLTEVVESTLYNSEDGFPSNILINVFKIANKLIFSTERGFYSYNAVQDRFEPLADYNELLGPESTIVDMEMDEIGNIYFIEQQSLGVVRPQGSHDHITHTSTFNKVRSDWNDDLGNITVLDNKNILIGGKQGFIHYSPGRDIAQNTPFNIRFKRIISRGKEEKVLYSGHSVNGRIPEHLLGNEFRFKQNSFSFDYVATHFESKDEVMYQYMLENYDEEWSEWSYDSQKEYTNLHEGTYTFWLKARNIFDEESEVIGYTFEIKPPIHRTIAAYSIYSLGTIMLLFMAYKWQDSRHKKETLELEKKQDRELKKKDSEIESITEKSEAEIVRLRNDKLRSEVNLKSQALTSSAMHLIQKNQLLSDIKSALKHIAKEESDKKNLNTKLTRLVKSIDKDLAGGKEWTQFEENFDQVHGNFITRLKESYPGLTPQEIKFSAYIRMNLNTKEIANLLGISVRGVEIGRYRVRKKLKLERKDNLSDFLLRF